MVYPASAPFTATVLTALLVDNTMLGVLATMTQGAGVNSVAPGDPPRPDYQKYILGFCVRLGLPIVGDAGGSGADWIDRWDTRFLAASTSTDSLLFASDLTTASSIATALSRTQAQVIRTAAHIYLAMYTTDKNRFFIPTL